MRSRHRSLIAASIAVVLVVSSLLAIAAEVPFRETVTVDAGSGSMTYSNGVNNAAFSYWRVLAVLFNADNGVSVTSSATYGVITNQIGTKQVLTANASRLYIVTNPVWQTVNDGVLFLTSDTNAFSAYVIGEER